MPTSRPPPTGDRGTASPGADPCYPFVLLNSPRRPAYSEYDAVETEARCLTPRFVDPANLHPERKVAERRACGFDASMLDPLGRQMLAASSFAELTARVMAAADRLCEGRIAVSHEGGYSPSTCRTAGSPCWRRCPDSPTGPNAQPAGRTARWPVVSSSRSQRLTCTDAMTRAPGPAHLEDEVISRRRCRTSSTSHPP
jgi:hypothetical protein